jgi:hypothetical protein
MLSGGNVMRFETTGMGLEIQRPGTDLLPGFSQDDGCPVNDENDLIFMANITGGSLLFHNVFKGILNGLMEGDFYGG